MKTIERRPILKAIVADLLIYAFFCLLLHWLGAYHFSYMEHISTFYYDWYSIVHMLGQPGGFCTLVADFLTQFFVYPAAAMFISAGLLTLITILGARIVRFMSGTLAYTPLALFPAVSLAFLHFNGNYMYSGTIAFAMSLGALNALFSDNYTLKFGTTQMRLFYTVLISFFLYATASAGDMLFCILVIMGSIFKAPRTTAYYLICPAIVFVQAWVSVRSGLVCDLQHALLPDAFYTPYMKAPLLLWLPWISTLGVYLTACVLQYFNNYSENAKRIIFVVLLGCTVIYTVLVARVYVLVPNETFKQYNCLLRNGNYDAILADTLQNPQSHPQIRNCVNLAIAMKDGSSDVKMLRATVTDHTLPYVYMLLSDMLYVRGEIAQSQHYAFDANTALGNESPRMLQRLVLTNIIFGNYEVAEKYLTRLDKTLFYRDWARRYRALLSDEASQADPEITQKRSEAYADSEPAYHVSLKPLYH